MSQLVKRAELTKFGALLDVPVEQLDYLDSYDIPVLRHLRDQATDMLYAADHKRLHGLATATAMMPVAVSAKIVAHFVPARLAGRVAGLVEPAKAVELSLRLPATYLADLTPSLDPRRARAILGRIPAELVVAVGKLLGARRDYITMGRMVSYLDRKAVALTIAALDDETLLHSGFMIEDPAQVAAILEILPEDRLTGMLRVAHEHGLWAEELSLLATVPDDVRRRTADLAAGEGTEVLEEIIATAHRENGWDLLLALSRSMSPDSRSKLAAVLNDQPSDVIAALSESAARTGLLAEFDQLMS